MVFQYGGPRDVYFTAAVVVCGNSESFFHDFIIPILLKPRRYPILSSMPLQVLFYLNSWYFAAFFIAEILMFIYKGILLPYPQANLILDIVLLLLFLGLEALRLFYGWKGNLCERSLMLIVSVGVLVPCTVLSVYYLLLQTFILRLEFILNAILLCFYTLELVLALITIAVFSRTSVY